MLQKFEKEREGQTEMRMLGGNEGRHEYIKKEREKKRETKKEGEREREKEREQ